MDSDVKNVSRLLVADPDPYVGKYISSLFKKEGYEVYVRERGGNVISEAEKLHPDIILLDIKLPDIDGFELCSGLRDNQDLHEIPVLLLGSFHNREIRLKGIEAGADDFIVKPFDIEELRIRVNTISRLDRYRKLLKERERIQKIKKEEEEKKQKLREKSRRALQQSKKHFENLSQLSPVGIFSTDEDGYIQYVNSKWSEISGISKNDAKGVYWIDTVYSPDYNTVRYNWERSIDSDEPFSVEHRFKSNNVIVWVLTQTIAERDENGKLTGFIGTITNLTEKHKKEKDILNTIVQTQESERKKFAETLHDSVGQLLSATKMHLNAMNREDMSSQLSELYDKSIELLENAINETRSISHSLTPSGLKEFGLISSLESIIKNISSDNSLKINFEHDIDFKLNEDMEIGIYRIIQESLHNIMKHANASRADIYLKKRDYGISLKINDDGEGFQADEVTGKGVGLHNIRNRVRYLSGDVEITSKPAEGTSVDIFLPK